MNTGRGRAKFRNLRILLDSGCSSMIVMGRLVEKLKLETYSVMKWHTQDGNITTNLKLKLDSPYPHSSQKMLWRGNFMWMNLIRVDTI